MMIYLHLVHKKGKKPIANADNKSTEEHTSSNYENVPQTGRLTKCEKIINIQMERISSKTFCPKKIFKQMEFHLKYPAQILYTETTHFCLIGVATSLSSTF